VPKIVDHDHCRHQLAQAAVGVIGCLVSRPPDQATEP
jgi:hypothetical protein